MHSVQSAATDKTPKPSETEVRTSPEGAKAAPRALEPAELRHVAGGWVAYTDDGKS